MFNSKRANPVTAQLLNTHQTYQHYNQEPHPTSMRLSELGHPLSRWFNMVQAVFDSLYYCSNGAERFMAFGSGGHEQIRLRRPEIREPKGFSFQHAGQSFVMPMPKQTLAYQQFLDAFAAAGFPQSNAHLGEVFFALKVRTLRNDLKLKIMALIERSECLKGSFNGPEISISLRRKKNGSLPPINCWLSLITLLRREFKRYLLTSPASPATPKGVHLFVRPFCTGNVKTLTITEHKVVGPLISPTASNVDRQIVMHDINNLIAQGYPVNNNLQAYMDNLRLTTRYP